MNVDMATNIQTSQQRASAFNQLEFRTPQRRNRDSFAFGSNRNDD